MSIIVQSSSNNGRVEKFATIYEDRIVAIADAILPHELKENQIEISKEEFQLINNVESIEKAKEMIKSLEKRIRKIK